MLPTQFGRTVKCNVFYWKKCQILNNAVYDYIISYCQINARLMRKLSVTAKIRICWCQIWRMMSSSQANNFYSQVSLEFKMWFIWHFKMPIDNPADASKSPPVNKTKLLWCLLIAASWHSTASSFPKIFFLSENFFKMYSICAWRFPTQHLEPEVPILAEFGAKWKFKHPCHLSWKFAAVCRKIVTCRPQHV